MVMRIAFVPTSACPRIDGQIDAIWADATARARFSAFTAAVHMHWLAMEACRHEGRDGFHVCDVNGRRSHWGRDGDRWSEALVDGV